MSPWAAFVGLDITWTWPWPECTFCAHAFSHCVSRATRMLGTGWCTGPPARAPSTPRCTAATATLPPRPALPSISTDLVRPLLPGFTLYDSPRFCVRLSPHRWELAAEYWPLFQKKNHKEKKNHKKEKYFLLTIVCVASFLKTELLCGYIHYDILNNYIWIGNDSKQRRVFWGLVWFSFSLEEDFILFRL